MIKKSMAAALCLSLGAVSCARPKQSAIVELPSRVPVSRDPVILAGIVVDENTNQPLPSVRLQLDRSGYHGSVLSDSLGRFRLTIDAAGLWVVEAQRDGYVLEHKRLNVQCGDGVWTVEGWHPASCPVPPGSLTIRMRAWAGLASSDSLVTGRVIDEGTGEPLYAIIRFAGKPAAVTSSQTGSYSMPGRSPGVYQLEVTVFGYEDERRIVVTTCPTSLPQCTRGGAVLNVWMRAAAGALVAPMKKCQLRQKPAN